MIEEYDFRSESENQSDKAYEIALRPKEFQDFDFDHFFIQPMDGKDLQKNILQSVSYCIENPLWRLSLQTHKIMGID